MTIAKLSDDRVRQYPTKPSWANRWWIVATALIALGVGEGSINLFCFGVFLKPVSADLGLSRGTLSSALLIASLSTAVATPFVGALIDRFGSRAVLLPGIALFAIAVTARATLQSSATVPLYALYLIAGLSGSVQTPIIYAAVICRWFDRQRGLAVGVAMAGTGLGVLVVPEAMSLIVQSAGWRSGYVVLGTLIFICAFIPVCLFVRDPPEHHAPLSIGRASALSEGVTFVEAVTHSWRFWCLSIAFLIGAACIFGTLAHAVAILTDRGMQSATAATALSIAGLAMIAGRIASGYALDKARGPGIAILSFLVPMAGVALLASGIAGIAPFVALVLCGLGQGAQVGLQPYFSSRYFGLKSIGAISGAMFGVFLIGAGLGPYISGACFDYLASYTPALITYAVALGLASLFFVSLGSQPFAAPAQRNSRARYLLEDHGVSRCRG
jgi:predicted MFS family arabinose efflux permease